MDGACRGEVAQPTTVFDTVIGELENAVYIPLYEARFVEVKKHTYRILLDYNDASEPELFRDGKLGFDVSNDAELEVRTQLDVIKDFSHP